MTKNILGFIIYEVNNIGNITCYKTYPERGKMGKTIALIMQKGGSGKTTICDQLAFSLKEQGKTVEVLDLDDQQGSRFQNEGIEDIPLLIRVVPLICQSTLMAGR